MVSMDKTERAVSPIWAVLCFGLAGGQSAAPWRGPLAIVLATMAGLMLGALMLGLLHVGLALLLGRIGWRNVRNAIARGFLLMVPFIILAFAARWILGWYGTDAFISAGILTSAAGVGSELARYGGNRLWSAVLPMLGGVVLASVWTIAAVYLAYLLG